MAKFRFWWLGLVVVLWTTIVFGLEASQVFTAVNSQGRPLVGASVSVTDSVGDPVTACSNAACTTSITQIPASGLFQFWAASGTYNVNIAGSGVTRSYVEVIPSAAVTGAITDGDFPGNYDSLMRRTAISGTYGQIRINTAASSDPTVNDDVSLNYGVNSFWTNIVTDTVFICADATDGAAVWREVGSANIADGTISGQVPYWNGSTWTPTSWLSADATHAYVGDTGNLQPVSTFQIGQINASTTLDIYSQVAAVILNTVVGQIRFGSTDSSSTPREAAFIKARALDAWGAGSTSAATSLDFLVQANDGSTIGDKMLRVQPLLVIAGEDIADNSLQGQARFVAQGVSITDTTATTSSVFLASASQDVPVKQYTLPINSGTSGYYLSTNGNATFPALSWAAIASAPGSFAVTGQTTTTAALVAPSYAFILDTDSGLGSSSGNPCIVDEANGILCVNYAAADTATTVSGALQVTSGVTSNDTLRIAAVGGSGKALSITTSAFTGQEIVVDVTEFILDDGEVTFSGISGDADGRALCKKADDNIGTCSDAPNGSGVCTCG